MTLSDLEDRALFQSNNDPEDLTDFIPALVDYINEGYDRLLLAFNNKHLTESTGDYPALSGLTDTPKLPEWAHMAIGDYATYCIYRNGNPSKQQRGQEFLAAFLSVEKQLKYDITKNKGRRLHGVYLNVPES